MAPLGVGPADRHPQNRVIVETRGAEVCSPRGVDPLKEFLVERVVTSVTETNEIQLRRGRELESIVRDNPPSEFLREVHAFTDVLLEAGHTERSDHKPQLERAEPTSQRNLPITIVDYFTGLGRLVAQEFR